MNALAQHLAKAQRDHPSTAMTYLEDRGSVFDVPIETVWYYLEKDQEFHPEAHGSSLRHFEGKDLSEVTSLISCEVRWGGRWRRMVSRITSIRPAVRINEALEGPYAGSKMVSLYFPRGRRTAIDVLCYMQSSELAPAEIKRDTLEPWRKRSPRTRRSCAASPRSTPLPTRCGRERSASARCILAQDLRRTTGASSTGLFSDDKWTTRKTVPRLSRNATGSRTERGADSNK